MATKTTKPKSAAKPKSAPVEPTNVLDAFKTQLIGRVRVADRLANVANLATVMLGEVLAAMFDAADDDTPAIKADAPKAEQKARRDKIRQRVLDYVTANTGHFYSWSTVSAWIDAAKVNATLPDSVRVTLDDDDPDAIPTGSFGVWPLRALGRIEDLDRRSTIAEQLAAEGLTTQAAVEDAVKTENGETTEPLEPIAASRMVEALVKRYRKNEAGTVGKVEHIALGVGIDDALELADFGASLWQATKTDPAIKDPAERKRKRLQVFRDAAEQILEGTPADDDDGAEDGSEPVL